MEYRSSKSHGCGLLFSFLTLLECVGDYTSLVWRVVVATLTQRPRWSLVREQLYHTGVGSLPIITITGLSTGLVLAAQSFFQVQDAGLISGVGLMVSKSMMTELGPVLTAFMMTGRVGASTCSEIGAMKVTEQIDALETMAVNSEKYLMVPRFIAGMVMTPLLSMFTIFMGVFGGYLLSIFYFHLSSLDYLGPIALHMTRFDILVGLAKASFFGFLLVTIPCYKGSKASGGAFGVGHAITGSVVISCIFILLANFVMTLGLRWSL